MYKMRRFTAWGATNKSLRIKNDKALVAYTCNKSLFTVRLNIMQKQLESSKNGSQATQGDKKTPADANLRVRRMISHEEA